MFARHFQSNRLAVDFGFTRARQLGGVHSGVWRKAVHLAGLNEHRASGLDMLRLMGRQAQAWLSRVRHRLPNALLAGSGVQSLPAIPLIQPDLQSVPRVTALRPSSLVDERSWLFRHPLWWSVALVLVSVQYRLGIDGFLHFEGEEQAELVGEGAESGWLGGAVAQVGECFE